MLIAVRGLQASQPEIVTPPEVPWYENGILPPSQERGDKIS